VFAVAILLGLTVGALRRGRVDGLARLRRGPWWLVAAALVLQVAGSTIGRDWSSALRFAVVLMSYALLGVWFAVQAIQWGGPLRWWLATAALGWALNLAVMLPNHGMPVSASAIERAHGSPDDISTSGLLKHVRLTPRTSLAPLGDVIPLPYYGAVSIGDFAIALGLFGCVMSAMTLPEVPRGTLLRPREAP
jgi:hypothetical protein